MGQRGAAHPAAQLRVERKPHPVADNCAVRGRDSLGQGQGRGAIGDESNVKVVEERTADRLRTRAHGSLTQMGCKSRYSTLAAFEHPRSRCRTGFSSAALPTAAESTPP